MEFYLPTRAECQLITDTTDAFFVSETIVEGQNVEMYNYRLASISDFTDHNAFELRGLTFVQNSETKEWTRHLLLNKFFNINQTIGWMEDEVQDKKITRVQNKEDGSIISFVYFDEFSQNFRAKSKMSFTSEQAEMAQNVYNNSDALKLLIHICFESGVTPIFELVSPENQIVLEYQKTELVLLQMRYADGTYFSVEDMTRMVNDTKFDDDIVPMAEDFEMEHIGDNTVLEYLLKQKETNQDNIEGWVVTFEDGQMAKIKTNKYLSLHGLIGPDAFRENLLVQTILNGDIDDVIAALVPGVKKDKIIAMDEKLVAHFNHLVVEFKELRNKYFVEYKEVRKDFAIAFSKNEMFGGVMKSLKLGKDGADVETDAEAQVKAYISRKCNGLNDAKKYLEGL